MEIKEQPYTCVGRRVYSDVPVEKDELLRLAGSREAIIEMFRAADAPGKLCSLYYVNGRVFVGIFRDEIVNLQETTKMKFKVYLTQKRPLDGLPCFHAVTHTPYYLDASGQTEEECLNRIKAKLVELVDDRGLVKFEEMEVEV